MIRVLALAFAVAASQFISTDVLEAKIKVKVVDHKGQAFGMKKPPEWVMAAVDSNSKVGKLYPEKQVFAMTQTGIHLQDLQTRMNTIGINEEVARIAATAVVQNAREKTKSASSSTSKGVSGKTANEIAMSSQFENSVQQAARGKFTGVVKEADWWILNREGKKEYYIVTVLYYMDKDLFDKQILALNKQAAEMLEDDSFAKEVEDDVDSALNLFEKVYESENPVQS